MPDSTKPEPKKPVPAWRTIVPGIWEDILDLWVATFEVTSRGGVGVAVFVQDQFTEMLNLFFVEEKFTGLTLEADTTIEGRFITLTALHGLTNANSQNHVIELSDTGTAAFTQSKILDVTGDVVELDKPPGMIFTTGATTILTGNPNIIQDAATGVAIDGSSTPVVFSIKPLAGQSGDITRILVAGTTSNQPDATTFIGAPALRVGFTLRAKRLDGTFRNIFSYKDNTDFILHGWDIREFSPKATGNTVYSYSARITFSGQDKHGVTVRLEGNRDEELQIVVHELQDNTATGNLSLVIMTGGSELQE